MRRSSSIFTLITASAILFCCALPVSAQTAPLRGSVRVVGADGKAAPVAGALIDVYRTDMRGEFHTKTEKGGDWVFAGLPLVGTYIVSVSAPGAQPNATGGIRVINGVPVDVVLQAGDGKRLTMEEAKAVAGSGKNTGNSGGESAADKAKREELAKKNAEIEAKNKKVEESNKVVGEAFKAGNAALQAKNYDEAIKQYDVGLAADPDQSALLTGKAEALKGRGVEKYNAAIQTKDEAAKTSGIEAAKADFKAAAEAATKAAEIAKAEPAATDPNEQKRQAVNKYVALSVRAETMRLFVTKADPTQADAGASAFQEYIAVETDPAKKTRAELDLAQMLLDAGAGDKAYAEYQKILAEKPDDADANLGAGLALFSTGDKAKYQEAANYLQRFVDKAPDTHKFKNDAKAILAELKSTENVVPEKTTPRRRRP